MLNQMTLLNKARNYNIHIMFVIQFMQYGPATLFEIL